MQVYRWPPLFSYFFFIWSLLIVKLQIFPYTCHIKKFHLDHIKDIEESSRGTGNRAKTSIAKSGLRQLSFQGSLNKVKSYPKNSPRYRTLLRAVVEFICFGLQPISVADDPSFRKLMATADPSFAYLLENLFSTSDPK